MENLLNVQNLTMSYGVDELYKDVGFGVSSGEKIAVVGPNGCGKSTLFKLLAGRMRPDDGEIVWRSETSLSYLAQTEDFAADDTPRKIVARAMRPVREAIDEYGLVSERIAESGDDPGELDELIERQSLLQERIQKIGGWSWEHRVEEMLDRLGVTEWIDEPIGRLSGGQRRRVDLARVLLESPDLLLLDEPTNHLDTTAAEWLEDWLIDHTSTLLFVTHDRYFLERVADRILEIDDDGFYDYPGNYDTFMERKLHRTQIRRRTEKRRKKHLKKELEWLSGGVKSQNTRSKKRIEKIENMQDERPYIERDIEMELGEAGEFDDVILAARGLWKSHGELPLLEHAHFDVRPDDKIGIIGPNGCGKSTLLETLAGHQRYEAGTIEIGKRTDIAFLRQDAPSDDPKTTVFDALGESDYVWIGRNRYHKQAYLKRFLFDRHLQKSQLRSLSGGQKRRFAIARVFAENPNVLFLDEPTNDLDIMSLQALETALREFDGCVVTVSHDRYFLNRVCNRIVAFEDKKLVRYDGNYDAYRRRREEKLENAEAAPEKPAKPAPRPKPKKKRQKKKGLSYRENERLKSLEDEIETTESKSRKIQKELSDPELYESRSDEIEPLNRELSQLKSRLEKLVEEWSALEERRAQ